MLFPPQTVLYPRFLNVRFSYIITHLYRIVQLDLAAFFFAFPPCSRVDKGAEKR